MLIIPHLLTSRKRGVLGTILPVETFEINNKTLAVARAIHHFHMLWSLFPTLAVGLLDFKVDVVLARLEADFSDQPPSIPALPSHQVSLHCPTTKYPCSAQLQSIPAVPNCKVSLQCPTNEYPCSAQPLSILTTLHCPTAKYPCSAQPPRILALPNRRVSLQCPATEYPYTAQPQSVPAVPNH